MREAGLAFLNYWQTTNMRVGAGRGRGIVYQCQFGCEILKMVGPKMQDFCPRINKLKGFFFFKSCDDLRFVKKCRNCTFRVNFLCQKSTEFFQKKFFLRISILETIFCKKHFFLTSIFEPLYFLKSCPIFDEL